MFVGLHAVLAGMSNTPELMLSEMEGDQFMKSAQNVMRHYSVTSTQKTLDWIAFAGCTAGIYAPRIIAIRMRKKGEAPIQHAPQTPTSKPNEPAAPIFSVVPGPIDEAAE